MALYPCQGGGDNTMAKKYRIGEAYKLVHSTDIDRRREIAQRYPLFATASAEEIIIALNDRLSARSAERSLRGFKPGQKKAKPDKPAKAADDDESKKKKKPKDEEAEEKKAKKAKGKAKDDDDADDDDVDNILNEGKGKKGKADPDDDDPDDPDDDDDPDPDDDDD